MHRVLAFVGKNETGGVTPIFGLVSLIILSTVGFSVDYVRAGNARTKLKAALDTAVLAAAAKGTLTSTQRIDLAKKHFAATFTEPSPPVPTVTINGDTVTATASYTITTMFYGVAGYPQLNVAGLASAKAAVSNKACVILLEPTQIGLTINSNSELNLGCGVHVNSTNGQGIYVNSQSKIVASDVCVKGGAAINGGSSITPAAQTNCPVKADPLASVAEPAVGSCNFTDRVIQSGATTINPGVYCKKLEIQNGAIVTMNPGTYLFPDAELIINSGGRLSGAGVMLFFNDDSGRLNANSGARVQLSAPTSGTYQGIVLFQSRAASSASAPPHIVNSDSSSYFQGTIYAPNGKLMLNSQSSLNFAASYTAVVARTMELNSNGIFKGNNNYAGPTPLPPGLQISSGAAKVALVQ